MRSFPLLILLCLLCPMVTQGQSDTLDVRIEQNGIENVVVLRQDRQAIKKVRFLVHFPGKRQ
jgi:hypothetical protein